MSRGQRVRAAVAWLGLGLIAGAMAWSVIGLSLTMGVTDEDMSEWAMLGTMLSWLLGVFVLGIAEIGRAHV